MAKKTTRTRDWARRKLKGDCPEHNDRFWLEIEPEGKLWHICLRTDKNGVIMKTVKPFKYKSEAEFWAAKILLQPPDTIEVMTKIRGNKE